MAITTYSRVRLFWGAFDVTHQVTGYGAANNVSLGASAREGAGTAIRRSQLVFSRTAPATYAEDVATMHFDWVNYTAGNPDDTWTAGDFTTLEGFLTTWWATMKTHVGTDHTFREIRWYRKGHLIVPPNPAIRVTSVAVAGTAAGTKCPPQCAMSITNKTGSRKHWGRTYLPGLTTSDLASDGRLSNAFCDAFAGATDTLYTSAAGADFNPVVYAPSVGSGLAVEAVQVDNIADVIRSRRWESTTYRKKYPV